MDDDFPDHDGPRDKFRRERDVSREEINGPPKRYRGDDDRERERERERDRRSRSPDGVWSAEGRLELDSQEQRF